MGDEAVKRSETYWVPEVQVFDGGYTSCLSEIFTLTAD